MALEQCYVRLDKVTFSKIRMACTAKCVEDGEVLDCNIKQTGADTFTIRMGMPINFN